VKPQLQSVWTYLSEGFEPSEGNIYRCKAAFIYSALFWTDAIRQPADGISLLSSFSLLQSKSIGINIDIRIIGNHQPVDKSTSFPTGQIQCIFSWYNDKRMLLIPHFVINPASEPAFIRGYDVMPGT
jgi:hypothetical protein